MSIIATMRDQMEGGGAFIPADFSYLDPSIAAQRLSRLGRQGWLRHQGKGVYLRGEVEEEEIVRAVLRKIGEPRFLPARDAALLALGVGAGRDKAALTTSAGIKKFPATLPPGWALLQRDPSRRECSELANLVLEVVRWQPKLGKQVRSRLVALLRGEVGLGDLGPALEHERSWVVRTIHELADDAGWLHDDLDEIQSVLDSRRRVRR